VLPAHVSQPHTRCLCLDTTRPPPPRRCFRWRTALVIRELEQEIDALARGLQFRDKLKELMHKKELVGDVFNHLRLARQRWAGMWAAGAGAAGAVCCWGWAAGASDWSALLPCVGAADAAAAAGGLSSASVAAGPRRFLAGSSQLESFEDEEAVNETLAQLLMVMESLDGRIGPMLEQDGSHFNERWGYLSR
jgi:hypothetical protein